VRGQLASYWFASAQKTAASKASVGSSVDRREAARPESHLNDQKGSSSSSSRPLQVFQLKYQSFLKGVAILTTNSFVSLQFKYGEK